MIDAVYSMKAAPGKIGQALEWAKNHLKLKVSVQAVQAISILQPITGETSEIVWVDRYPSLAVYEEAEAKKAQDDSGWVASVDKVMESDWYLGHTVRILKC
jgi:hypothetical protein